MLSEQAQRELHQLALERVDNAVGDVAQLLDDNEQVMRLMIHVAISSLNAAANFMHDTAKMPNGKHPPKDACQAKLLGMLADAMGMESKVVSPDEAKKLGLKR